MPRKNVDDEHGGKTGAGKRAMKDRLTAGRSGHGGPANEGSNGTRWNDV